MDIVHELEEKGYSPEIIAAVLIQSQLPLSDAADLNAEFSRKKNRRESKVERKAARKKGKRQKFGPEKTKRLFINIGEKDKVQKRDILGAICGEAGISSSDVGNIDMYHKFTFVDIDVDVAKKVEKKLNGKYIKDHKVKVEISKKRK